MEITQLDSRAGGEFIANKDGEEAGKLFYNWAGIDKLIIKHTETYPRFAHQGVGLSLVTAVVEFARNKHIKILPVCAFARGEFRKHPEWADVLE